MRSTLRLVYVRLRPVLWLRAVLFASCTPCSTMHSYQAFTPATPEEAIRLPIVLVLASGQGQRFWASGGTTHKLQADLCGASVKQRTLDAVAASGLRWYVEEGGLPGMGDSIAAAVRANHDAPGWMVLPGDLPLVQPHTLLRIARAPMAASVLLPVYAGQRGHPVRFASQCGEALRNLQGSMGASPVVRAQAAIEMIVDDRGCVFDIDTVQDLQRAKEWLLER